MISRTIVLALALVVTICTQAQFRSNLSQSAWVDSVFKTLNKDEKIAQLMVVRGSSFEPRTRKPILFTKEVEEQIKKYNVGGICMFQGGPLAQANFLNYMQRIAKTPILICIDAENGLGMRMDSVLPLPRQLMLGAMNDPKLMYEYGRLVGEQCKRMGIQVNYAPVVDVNNNPANPVINDRSFGEDKFKVAEYGVQYSKGMQDVGVMACAKHFPGHGDVSVDSHLDLPVINKNKSELQSLELYPFQKLFDAGVGSVMIAHLYIPAIDNTANRATSLSKANVTRLLRNEMNYKGISFTDALEMRGVTKFFPDGDASVESLIAGNDMLCLPGDIPGSIQKVKEAIKKKKLKWSDIDNRVKKVLRAKYQYGLANLKPIDTTNLTNDVNRGIPEMRRRIAEQSLTLVRNSEAAIFPLMPRQVQNIAYVAMGVKQDNAFARRMRDDYGAHVYYFDYSLNEEKAKAMLDLIRNRYQVVIIGLHNYARFPANNFGVSKAATGLLQQLQQENRSITFAFGNPYILSNTCDAKVLVACYEDDETVQEAAADLLQGKITPKGKLPVTVCPELKYGTGITTASLLPDAPPSMLGFDVQKLHVVDSIVKDGIDKQAYPGAVVLVAKDGRVVYEKAFGQMAYTDAKPVTTQTIYDLASVTKICATTMSIMKLYDEGRLDLHKPLGDFLPWVRNTNKELLTLDDILLHQAGLKAWIPFYRETIDSANGGAPMAALYATQRQDAFNVRVAENMYLRRDWIDTMYSRILTSELGPRGKYIYSDNDFIFLGKIVESVTGMPLDEYVQKTFYVPLGMKTTGFKPRERFNVEQIAPTEQEPYFRKQLIQGDVHDPGAAMFGGVAGHAGLFSNARDLAVLSQLMLNGGVINGKRYFKQETIDYFTAYHTLISRRGLGFDKPEKNNYERPEPYPCASASPATFGHTGFTGTCWWVDPKYNLVFIFLSNRVNSSGPNFNKLGQMNIRGKVHEAIYKALGI
ncbi:MAG TPA: glycoside hydrolase family 3 N-terminal domain-containing protein [Chitinophagaceae bacterium]|nr:glycoside hydrolase family 3 N-terminal domain-containing protein [Chitinophagaceae bacterium]